ncbi:hypothetical protein ACF0H5_018765 [Mactra antiquata]
MALLFRLLVSSTVLFLSDNVYVYSHSTKDVGMQDMFEVLKEKMEAIDAVYDAKLAKMEAEFKRRQDACEKEISALKSKIETLEADFKFKEMNLQEEIQILKAALKGVAGSSFHREQDDNDTVYDRKRHALSGQIKRQTNIRKGRTFPEIEVAFYATQSANQVHHLGSDQILHFQTTITNIGKAFNNYSGAFVAPTDGTYVFHATILAIDIPTNHTHFRAHFDVNGLKYSVFFVTSYDQSSQMLVINLKTGDTVTIRNDYPDYGFFGDHHSTFSGFLLYEHPSGVVIGK